VSQYILDLPFKDYLAHKAFSSSDLKLLLQGSAKQLRARKDGLLPSKKSEALSVGSYHHCAILEPSELAARYSVVQKFDRKSEKAKARFAAIEVETTAAGKELIWGSVEDIEAVAKEVRAHPQWTHICGPEFLAETSIFWEDEETGLPLKMRADGINPVWVQGERMLIVDVKTARSAELEQFTKDALRLQYDLSSSMYQAGALAHFGVPADFCWVACEKAVPFEVTVVFPSAGIQEHGRGLFRKALTELAECVRTDTWLGYGKGLAQKAELPAWMR